MEDLNEKWKEGKLPDGEYFCKTSLGAIDIFKCIDNCFFTFADENQCFYIEKVISLVPTYKGLRQLQNIQEKTWDYDIQAERISELLLQERALREAINHEKENCQKAIEDKKNLFKLLEECLQIIYPYWKRTAIYEESQMIGELVNRIKAARSESEE